MDDETLKTYGYVISSSYREKSVKSLNDGDKIPTDLAEDIGVRTNHEFINNVKEKALGEDVAKLID